LWPPFTGDFVGDFVGEHRLLFFVGDKQLPLLNVEVLLLQLVELALEVRADVEFLLPPPHAAPCSV
jgi:hypothetical protein